MGDSLLGQESSLAKRSGKRSGLAKYSGKKGGLAEHSDYKGSEVFWQETAVRLWQDARSSHRLWQRKRWSSQLL